MSIIDASFLYKEEFYGMKYIVKENNSPIDDEIIVGESYTFNEITDYLLDRDLDYKYISIPKPKSPERDDISSDDFVDEILRYIIKIRKFRDTIFVIILMSSIPENL